MENIEDGRIDDNIIIEEVQNKADMQKEFMLLGLRMIDGVSIQDFKNKFLQNPLFVFREQLNKLTKEKLILIDGNQIKLTSKGLDFANQVWMEFV